MKVSKTIETEEGTVQFQGELSQEEYDLVMEAGLAILLRMGVLNVVKAKPEEASTGVLLN